MIVLFFLALFASTNTVSVSAFVVYGDVHKDVEFFTRTFPWIVDNIGGEIYVEYYLLGSGRYSVPQMCAVGELVRNTFLQAQYLRCEAEGYPSEYCLCEAGVDPETFKRCVGSGAYLASIANLRFSDLAINVSPIVDLGHNNTVYGVDDISFLQNICTIFEENLPRGCVHYSNQTESFLEKKALAQFDRACHKEFPIDDYEPPTPTPTSTPWVTQTTSTLRPWVTQTTSTPWVTTVPTPTPTSTPWVTQTTSTLRPWVTQTTSTPWVTTVPTTTEGPTTNTESTPDWWSTTPPWWWSTTPWATQTTPTPWPWMTTARRS